MGAGGHNSGGFPCNGLASHPGPPGSYADFPFFYRCRWGGGGLIERGDL